MNTLLLDNPAWYALHSHHQHLARKAKSAVRYQPGIFIAAAMLENSIHGFRDLKSLVEMDETIGVLGSLPDALSGWEVIYTVQIPQMICGELKPVSRIEAVRLKTGDVPEMLDLISLAQPGPFLPRTIEMGQYIGLRQDGQLVAMAGERLHLTGFCEISAVCTHPEYRGRGFGSALTAMVTESIIERGETPFLHVAPENHVAMSMYNELGFYLRKEIVLTLLKKLSS